MSTMTSEREAFEKWVSEQPWFLATIYLARSGDEYADPCINSRWQGWKAHHLTRALSGAHAGWKLVPEIATPAMIEAGRAARPDGQFTGQCGEVYQAMIAASPTPDKEGER